MKQLNTQHKIRLQQAGADLPDASRVFSRIKGTRDGKCSAAWWFVQSALSVSKKYEAWRVIGGAK
jgi:hypothetical protein